MAAFCEETFFALSAAHLPVVSVAMRIKLSQSLDSHAGEGKVRSEIAEHFRNQYWDIELDDHRTTTNWILDALHDEG